MLRIGTNLNSVARYLWHRFIYLLVSLVAASGIIFILIDILPGSPGEIILGTQANKSSVDELNKKLGLNHPLYIQYFHWLAGLVTLHPGNSYISSQPIGAEIASAASVTFPLIGLAMAVSLLIALLMGVAGGISYRGKLGTFILGISQAGISVPSFVAAMLLMVIVGIKLHFLPTTGFNGWSSSVSGSLKSLILPALALAIAEGCFLSRYVRSSLIDVLNSTYYKTALAKGLTPAKALWRHGRRNVAVEVLTVSGMQLIALIVGAVIVESVFSLPGLGTLLVTSINNRDLSTLRDICMILSGIVLMMNFLIDIAYHLIDPRAFKNV